MDELSINNIRGLCVKGAIQWTNHIMIRLAQRDISRADIKAAIMAGEIIEYYPTDYPRPSCLILGHMTGRPIHVVVGVENERLWMITAYRPDAGRWSADFRQRKEK